MGAPRLILTIVTFAALTFATAGCTSEPTSAALATPPSETPAPDDCPDTRADDVTAEQAATCVYEGWIHNDTRMVAAYGAPGVTDPLPYAAADPGGTPEGCVAGEVDGETICSWTGEHSEGQWVVRMHVTDNGTDGYRVTTIDITL